MNDLKLIKKHYGENMMHLCRELFLPSIEEIGPDFLPKNKKVKVIKGEKTDEN